MNKIVVETCNCREYPVKATGFRPSQKYPEYPKHWPIINEQANLVYDCVRNAFIRMGYDRENQGTANWNPLKEIISAGNTVLVKPNFVHHRNASGDLNECLYTQPGVIAAVLDYVFLALGDSGTVIVGDAPMQDCDFMQLVDQSGLNSMISFYKDKGYDIRLVDFRAVTTTQENGVHHYKETNGFGKIIDLGSESEFSVLSEEETLKLRKGANDPADLHEHHNAVKHEYEVCNEMLQADVIIDMPKPKCHMKAGVTISLKNMVGINVRKEYLPHHTEGDKESGRGDAYEKESLIKRIRANARDKAYVLAIHQKYHCSFVMTQIRRSCALIVKLFFKDKLTEGTWYGNETISKTIIDLNKIAMYADKNGVMTDVPQRKRLIVADLIIAGEKRGPMSPSAKYVGAIAVGEDPVCFDETLATLMGADITRIPTLRNARNAIGNLSLTEDNSKATIFSNNGDWDGKTWQEIPPEKTWNFTPIDSWKKAFFVARTK